LAVTAGVLLVSGCVYTQPVELPMGGEYFHYRDSNTTLVLLLHGLGGSAANFSRNGTVEQILDCNPRVNVYGADSHFGYYRERIISARLREDVIQPALDAGVTRVWLLGVSLGGLGSLAYRLDYPEEVAGIVLMAPYLGEWDELEAYIADPASSNSDFVEIWRGLESMATQERLVTLAYGEGDSMYRQHRWAASLLAAEQVVSMPGNHRWSVWRQLWPRALQRSGLCPGDS
jgi:pimeloyl-ACP methyl ester carboxylesterase